MESLQGSPAGAHGPPAPAAGSTAFRDVLAEMERSSLNFSRHAQKRIEQRNLQMDGGRVERLEAAVERVTEKGSRDSLILLDELALVVSVRSKTVVTAIEQPGSGEGVFTNIDSVVIADWSRASKQQATTRAGPFEGAQRA